MDTDAGVCALVCFCVAVNVTHVLQEICCGSGLKNYTDIHPSLVKVWCYGKSADDWLVTEEYKMKVMKLYPSKLQTLQTNGIYMEYRLHGGTSGFRVRTGLWMQHPQTERQHYVNESQGKWLQLVYIAI